MTKVEKQVNKAGTFVGTWVPVMFIVATKQKDPQKIGAQVIGVTIFESFKEYTDDAVDFHRHLVPEGRAMSMQPCFSCHWTSVTAKLPMCSILQSIPRSADREFVIDASRCVIVNQLLL